MRYTSPTPFLHIFINQIFIERLLSLARCGGQMISAFVAHTFTDTEIDRLRQRICITRHAGANPRWRNRLNSRAMMCAYYVSTPISSYGDNVSS